MLHLQHLPVLAELARNEDLPHWSHLPPRAEEFFPGAPPLHAGGAGARGVEEAADFRRRVPEDHHPIRGMPPNRPRKEAGEGSFEHQMLISAFFPVERYKPTIDFDYTNDSSDESFGSFECFTAATDPSPRMAGGRSPKPSGGSIASSTKEDLGDSIPTRPIRKEYYSSSSIFTSNSVANPEVGSTCPISDGGHRGKKVIENGSSKGDHISKKGSTLCTEDVRHTQEEVLDRRTSTNSRLSPIKPLHCNLPLQDGRITHCQGTPSIERLDDVDRPEISIFTGGDKPTSPTSPHISVERKIHPLHNSPIWTEYRSQDLFENHEESDSNSERIWDQNRLLSGRHVDPCQESGRVPSSYRPMGTNTDRTGFCHQLGQVTTDSTAYSAISGSTNRLDEDVILSPRRQNSDDTGILSETDSIATTEKICSSGTGRLSGHSQRDQRMFHPVQDVYTLSAQRSNASIGSGLDKGAIHSLTGSKRGIAVVERSLALAQRSVDSKSDIGDISSTDRCQQSRLGRSIIPTRSLSDLRSGSLDLTATSTVEQCAGNDCSGTMSARISTPDGRNLSKGTTDSSSRIGQYDHSEHAGSKGKYNYFSKSFGNAGVAAHSEISIQSSSCLSTRSTKRNSGWFEQNPSDLHDGELPPSSYLRPYRAEFRSAHRRPICQPLQSPTSKIRDLEEAPQILAGRRFQPSMDSAGRSISEPTVCVDCSMSKQDSDRQSNGGARRTGLASAAVVATAAKTSQKPANDIAIPPESFYGSRRTSSVSGVDNSRVAFIRRELGGRRFSSHAVDTVLESWKDARDYDSAWKCWADWCAQHKVSLRTFDTAAEANFVSDMRLERKWRANTAITNCSRIRATIEVANGNATGTAFRRGLCRSLPNTSEQPEFTFDISQVERHLSQCGSAVDKSIKSLRSHTLAHFSLYFGCRSSDKAHVLRDVGIQLSPSCRVRFWNTKEMKSLTRLRQPLWTQWFEIMPNPDPALDLVSHLRTYIQRTPEVHSDIPVMLDGKTRLCTGLFVSLTLQEGKAKSLGAERLANLLVGILEEAGIDTAHINGHSARGAVASALIRSGVPLTEVLNRCRWSGIQTLAKHYLKPIPMAASEVP